MTRVTAREVVEVAARQFQLTPAQLRGPDLSDYFCNARFVTFKVIRELCPHISLPAMGELFNERHHTTVLSGVRRADLLVRHDTKFRAAYHELFDAVVAAVRARLDAEIEAAEARLEALKAERAAYAPSPKELQGA